MKDRSGDMVDCGLIRSLVGMLSAIDMYSKFESDLLAESNKYFLHQSKERINKALKIITCDFTFGIHSKE